MASRPRTMRQTTTNPGRRGLPGFVANGRERPVTSVLGVEAMSSDCEWNLRAVPMLRRSTSCDAASRTPCGWDRSAHLPDPVEERVTLGPPVVEGHRLQPRGFGEPLPIT